MLLAKPEAALFVLTIFVRLRCSIQRETPLEKQQLAVIAVFATAAWVAWLLFNSVRQYLLARSQAAAQDKLLLRVSSPESLQVFLASPAGAEFLRGLERSPNEAWRSIIRTTQTAVVFGILGIAMLACHVVFRETDGLLQFGIGAVVLAAAFGSSAVVSVSMHRRSGLLPSGRD